MESRLLDLLGLPDVEHVVYARSPLVLTICQVRFSPVLSIADTAFVAPFQRSIQHDYPVMIQGADVEVQLGLGSGAVELQRGRQSPVYQFSDRDDNWKIILAQDFLGIETRKYHDFEDFLLRLRSVLAVLVEHINPSVVSRIGLRYINEIRLDSRDLGEIIAPSMLGPLAFPPVAAHTSHTVAELLLAYPNNEQLRIRHGFLPRGTTVQLSTREEVNDKPFYLLDFDAFRDFTLPKGLPMEPKLVCELVAMYNKAIYKLFRWSIAEAYASRLGGSAK